MYFYFYSDYPAVVKLQGIYYGKIGNIAKFCRLEPPFPLVEICALSDGGRSYAFFPDDGFINSPPKNVSVTDLCGGYLLRFYGDLRGGEFRVIAQEKFADGNVTVFCDDGYKLSLETKSGFYAETLDFPPLTAAFTVGAGANAGLLFCEFQAEKENILCVYRTVDPALLLKKTCSDFSVTDGGFTVTEKFNDVAKHTTEYRFVFDGNAVTERERKVSDGENFDRTSILDKIVPYAFCEEFLLKGDHEFYLSDGIKRNADKLGDYLGEYVGVTTPPFFRDPMEVGLIKKVAPRRYRVDYFTFELENGKIVNVKKVE